MAQADPVLGALGELLEGAQLEAARVAAVRARVELVAHLEEVRVRVGGLERALGLGLGLVLGFERVAHLEDEREQLSERGRARHLVRVRVRVRVRVS